MPLMVSLVDWTWQKKEFLSLRIMMVETSQTEKQREKGLGKQNKTDYSRLFVVVGQLQRV